MYIVNNIAVDGLATKGASVLAAMELADLSQNIRVLITKEINVYFSLLSMYMQVRLYLYVTTPLPTLDVTA